MTYATLFDFDYAVQGLNLLRSIYRHEPDARVVVLAMDDGAAELCTAIRRPTVIRLHDVCDADYFAKATGLSRAEACWLATPYLCRHVLETYGACEYLDADCYLFRPLDTVRREIGENPIGIVPHRWDAEHADRLRANGTYNVGYLYFREHPVSVRAVAEWVNESLAWQPTPEHPRYSDQLLLEDWPARYGAHVIRHKGVNLAPYNQRQYDIRERQTGITVDGEPLCMYHFHEWRINEQGEPHTGGYDLQWAVRRYVYEPYHRETGATLGVIC